VAGDVVGVDGAAVGGHGELTTISEYDISRVDRTVATVVYGKKTTLI
jgi:hypothetical protein